MEVLDSNDRDEEEKDERRKGRGCESGVTVCAVQGLNSAALVALKPISH